MIAKTLAVCNLLTLLFVASCTSGVVPHHVGGSNAREIKSVEYFDSCDIHSRTGGELLRRCRLGQSGIAHFIGAQPDAPPLGTSGRCPAAWARPWVLDGPGGFGGVAIAGRRPVFPLVGVRWPSVKRRAVITGAMTPRGSLYFKTLWLSRRDYGGPWLVTGQGIGRSGPVRFGESGTATSIAVRGPTANEYKGFREVPGQTLVPGPGCYAWLVNGRGFAYAITFQVRAPEAFRDRE